MNRASVATRPAWRLRRRVLRSAQLQRRLESEIDRRQRAEQGLLDAQIGTALILHTLPDGAISFDDAGLIISINPAAEKLFGCSAAQAVGEPLAKLSIELAAALASLRCTIVDTPIADAVPAGGACRVTLDLQRPDGETLPLELTCIALRSAGQQVHVALLRDTSGQSRVERLQRNFVSVVSHELRTPLTSIRGALALLVDGSSGPLPATVQRLVVMASRNSERLVELVNDILDLEKLDRGELVVQPETLDLVLLLGDQLRNMFGFAHLYQVQLVPSTPTGPVWVRVDARRMAQVLANLLSNAIKFSPAGGEVLLRLRVSDGACEVLVIDHGPGIPAGFRGRVFDAFAQADAGDARSRGGTGLGLPITRALVERMQGRISFDCPPQGGTVFSVRLPLVPALSRDEGAADAVALAAPTAPSGSR